MTRDDKEGLQISERKEPARKKEEKKHEKRMRRVCEVYGGERREVKITKKAKREKMPCNDKR